MDVVLNTYKAVGNMIFKNIKLLDVFRMVPVGFYNGLIWTVSSMSINVNVHGADKIAHIAEYAGLGFLMAIGLGVWDKKFSTKTVHCVLLAILCGSIDELHQHFVPGRRMDILDLMADTLGISIGLLMLVFASKLLIYVKTKFFAESPAV